ncbi:zinc finger protein swm [Coccinella septempunctata]|uniref:zinc finger protein swm n=1 Tax=Coccinella septempunctata TaxID=41139 RepID=UPI001D077C07|nr:zinc finger protein swm [Coccinella septempunctata]
MIVEQPEAFKNWLTAVLKPMCDADPAALAKYVIALIKKDKEDDELRKSMVGQLEVFLEDETETFVNLVFQTLQSQEYITTPVIPNANPPNPNIVKKDKESVKEKVIVQPSELPNLNEQINGSKKEAEIKRDRDIRESRKTDVVDNKEKDDKARGPRRRDRSTSRDRLRSRSRSWDRSKRSRSRDKSRDRLSPSHRGGGTDREKRDRLPRVWRNKSPPMRSSRYERRRSRTPPSPNRSPRYQHRGGRYRNRSLDRSRSRSRSRSVEKPRRDSAKEKDREHSRPGTPTQDSNHGEPDLRLNTSTQSVQSCVVLSTKRKCRDFDEKGLCMRGEMCPFDHGVDPVVLEDAALSTVLNYNPNGAAPEIPTNIPPPILTNPGHPMMGPRGVIPSEYNPQAPFLRGFRGPRPLGPTRLPTMGMFPPQPNINRELISVPVMDNKQNVYTPGYPPQSNFIPLENHDPFYHQKKNKFDFNRLGARAPRNMVNCSLELKKIPAGLNSITHLNNHFSKFGKITNIQVNYEGDTEAAIVTFSSHAEASAAYRSTEAVLNNRFIKVFWHNANNDGKQENVPPRPVKERLGVNQVLPSNTNKVLNLVQPKAEEPGLIPPGSETADVKNNLPENTQINKEEAKAQAAANIKKSQELLAAKEKLKKNQDDKRKEVMKINQDLRKRKQELLEKQLSQQKILIEKMEKLPAGPQRDLIKETIKKTQESIEEIRKDIAQSISIKMAAPQKKTKEDAQKEILDIELDLITKQQEGADVTEIQKKYYELKAKTAMMRRGRGGRRYNPMQRHLLSKNNLIDNAVKSATKIDRTNSGTNLHSMFPKTTLHSIDHRPIRILVSGYENEEQDNVIAHFQQYGEIAEYITDPTLPSVTFNFKNRKDAEAALLKGKHFQDRTLSITWCSNVQHNNTMNNNLARKVVMSETEEEQLIDQSILEGDEEANGTEQDLPEEVLLQDDDEDDDEDRSWRR